MSDPKNRIRRILNIIPYVQRNQGVEIEELARYCGATASDILKDLDSILLCGVPPYLPDDYIGVYIDGGRVEINFASHFRRPVRFTPLEALALLLAIESLPEGGDDMLVEARGTLTAKIQKILERTFKAGTHPVDGRIETLTGTGPSHGMRPAKRRYEEALAALKPAVESRSEVEIEYYSLSSDTTAARVVQPYGFVDKGGDTYVVAFCTKVKGRRSFRLDRIRHARVLDGTSFTRPAKFDIERYARTKMDFTKRHKYVARVRVTEPRVIRWLEETRSSDVADHKDGSAVVTLRAYGLGWLVREILSYGPEAEVLEPAEVRAALHEHALAMAALVRADA